MKLISSVIIYCILFISEVNGQNDLSLKDTTPNKGFSIGTRHAGLGFGSLGHYSGIKFSGKENDSFINGFNFNLWGSITYYPFTAKINGAQIALGSEINTINGLTVNALYLESKKVNGVILNGGISDIGKFKGVNLSGILTFSDSSTGISVTGIVQVNDNFSGIAISPFNINSNSDGLFIGILNSAPNNKGVLIGGINACDNDFSINEVRNGVSIGCVNLTNCYNGLQIALFNLLYPGTSFLEEESKGIQIGLFNYSKSFTGLQIGLLNINKDKKRFKAMPFVNYKSR